MGGPSRTSSPPDPLVFKYIGSSWMLTVLQIVVMMKLTPFTLNALGKEPYGVWLEVVALTGLLKLLIAGVPMASVRFIAEALGKDDEEGLRRVVSTCVAMCLGLGGLALVIGGGLYLFFTGVYLQADDQGVTKLFRMPAAGGVPEAIVDPAEGTYSGLEVASKAAEDVVLATWQSYRRPAEVVRVDPAAKSHRALTAFNEDDVAQIDALPARHFWFTSRKGRRIHNVLFLPPGFDENKKYPLVLFIHGGPHSSSKDSFHPRWNFLLLASPGYVVLATNYTGSVGFGEKFARAIQGDPLKTPGEEIDQAAEEAVKRFPFIDGSRLAAGGASYGGHLSNWLQATTTRYRCLYSHAGLISLEGQWATSDVIYHRERNNGGLPWEGSPIWKEQSPFTYAKNFKTPVLLTIGVKDYRVPLNQTLAYWSVLKRLRVPSRLVVFPRANHWIMNGEDSRFFWQELLGWLEKYLKE